MEYEKDGFSWIEAERLEDLIKPERMKQIKEEHIKNSVNSSGKTSGYLIDIIGQAEDEGCAACFV